MKKWMSIGLCLMAVTAMAQEKTTVTSGWVKDSTYFYSKSGRDMYENDTLEILPYRNCLRFCCLNFTKGCPLTFLVDLGVYHEKSQNKQTFKGGIGVYIPDINTLITTDYHRTFSTNAQAIGLNVLKQLGKKRVSRTSISFHPIRAGFNAGLYKPKRRQPVPYVEPKLGIITPFGRGHLYTSYRFVGGNSEMYQATKGWNFGMTVLLTNE